MAGLIVHEWMSHQGGSEKVVDAMMSAFPDSQILCLWNDSPGRYGETPIQETWLANSPLRGKKALALPFMPGTWRQLKPYQPADWMLVSSHLFAHHAQLASDVDGARKYVYVHTPARYIWNPELDARGAGLVTRAASALLRPLDRKRAEEHRHVAANSGFVRKRIQDTWGIDSTVLYPPVDVQRISSVGDWTEVLRPDDAEVLASLPGPFILGASRFVPYKRLDLVIRIGSAAGLPVVLAGDGPEAARLRSLAADAPVPVTFVERPSSELLYALYQLALAFVFPAVEDFGIMPVEAMATGTPVLANRLGGASESVLDGVSGVHFDTDDISSAVRALDIADGLSKPQILSRASVFSTEQFQRGLRAWMGEDA